jgi:hypothetical protein
MSPDTTILPDVRIVYFLDHEVGGVRGVPGGPRGPRGGPGGVPGGVTGGNNLDVVKLEERCKKYDKSVQIIFMVHHKFL